jgi:hypothetical protein
MWAWFLRDLDSGNQTLGADASPNSGKIDRPSFRVTSAHPGRRALVNVATTLPSQTY